MSSKEIILKPGETLFNEGDQSKSLYFLKRGVVRIFKKKGIGSIEIETIRAGQILGELAFFDNNPRSASAEAVSQVELIEISKDALEDAVSKIPEWFAALIRTITARLRATNNRLRSLESLSTDYETDKFGNRSKEFTYITSSELLRFSTALLIASSRYGKPVSNGIEFNPQILERFGSQIMQVGSSKVYSLIEIFEKMKFIADGNRLLDIKFLDQMIQFLNEQNLVEPNKKRTLSEFGYKVLALIVDNRQTAVKSSSTVEQMNIAPILSKAGMPINQAQELHDQGFLTSINLVSGSEAVIQYDINQFNLESRVFLLLKEVSLMNESKRKASHS
jgi:CRP/FNR family cyclic AMP-dependent transcriptional regulator